MAIIGLSLIVASVVLFCLRPPAWLPNLFANLIQPSISGPAPRPPIEQPKDEQPEDEQLKDQHHASSQEAADPSEPDEDGWVTLSQSPPSIIIQEPLVDIEVTEREAVQTRSSWEDEDKDRREDGGDQQEEDDDEELQTTPKATTTPRDDPIPSLVLPDLSTPTELDEDNASEQPPPSFTVSPPPAFHIEPAVSPESASERERDTAPPYTPPSFTMTPPPASFNIDPESEPGTGIAPHQTPQPSPPPPQLNLVTPEQTSVATPIKTPSDLMPPPPLPKPKLSKPRISSIPLPASSLSSSPARRIPSLTNVASSAPTPSRIPSPPTAATRSASPTPTRTTKQTPNTPSPSPSITHHPPAATTTANRIPTLSGIPRRASPTPPTARTLPLPRRGAPSSSSSSGLMPPPTATARPNNNRTASSRRPRHQVTLQPGHSPLDWARLAQSPTSDLRNLPPHTPYLRVTPSMLHAHNGRHGRDAWSVYGGKVYNVSPYVAFHPGGGPELLRGAGKDASRLFAEVHPWVNYETMLQSCLIGLLVDEGEGEGAGGAMEEMD